MKFEIFKFKSVTSTNDVAIELIKKENETGCVYAGTQTRGRGTKGRKWISEKGNLFGYFQQPPQFSFINKDYQNVSFSLCEVI